MAGDDPQVKKSRFQVIVDQINLINQQITREENSSDPDWVKNEKIQILLNEKTALLDELLKTTR